MDEGGIQDEDEVVFVKETDAVLVVGLDVETKVLLEVRLNVGSVVSSPSTETDGSSSGSSSSQKSVVGLAVEEVVSVEVVLLSIIELVSVV